MKRPRMTYSFDVARRHLEEADVRFKSMFSTVDMTRFKPFLAAAQEGAPEPAISQDDDQWNMISGNDDAEVQQDRANGVEEIDLFRTMTTSIIGQQISWKAAKAVIWRFCSIFHPELGQAPSDREQFKSQLVFPAPLQVLSEDPRKYRGAGLSEAKARSVVDVARRFADGRLNVRRLSAASTEGCTEELVEARGVGPWTAHMVQLFALREPDVLPVGDLAVQRGMVEFFLSDRRGPKIARKEGGIYERDSPPPDIYTREIPFHPAGISHEFLRSRRSLEFKKRKYFLSPEQMELLTETWRPYRSVGALLMWCVVDEAGKKPAPKPQPKVEPVLEPASKENAAVINDQ
ncbi:3-methyladenine DNA glycosidase [Ceraceosorus bombacis]|uniref:3-methyladenine DNA glycosidase n=1 Tax=Ceraceosorus bombacis TaxID=401625 RepID=A0A0P1BK93_9BASI|nr:3-methyladenine DNA glycosidase [Ceraceosorus bombacis]